MTAFNGVDQRADITGITSGSAIIIKITMAADYSSFPPLTSYDCIVDGRAGVGNFRVEHQTNSTLLESNCAAKVNGVDVYYLAPDNCKNGDLLEIHVTDGTKVGTEFSLFQQPDGSQSLIISTSLVEVFNGDGTVKLHSFAMPDTISSLTINDSVGLASMSLVGFTVTPTGPTITGPDSTTEGAVTVQVGTLQDTITTQSLISGSYSIEQTIDSATAGTLTYNAESGVNQCTPSTPVAGVPLEPTITAAGITPYVVQQKADDGTNPPATRNIALNPEATHEVIQTMAGVANTNPDQSVFGSSYVIVEDNQQARVPKVVDGVTFTWFNDGTFKTDIDKTVTFQYELFSPASGNWSAIDLTVKDTVIVEPTPDTEKPVISLIGSASITVGLGSTYTDQGANVTDNVDADAVLVAQGSVNTNQLGVYSLTYDYTDAAGNIADTVYRSVEVVDVKPTIVLNGASTINHIINTTYTDAGAVAHDDVDVDVNITAVGTVNTTLEGVYTLTYDHTDTDTNAADTVYRTVNVFDPEASTGTGTDAVLGSVLS